MKAVLLAPLPPPSGGIASWANRMKNAKLKNGWTVEIVDEKVIGKREIFGANAKKKNIWTEIKRCFGIWKNLWKALNDKDAKIVHSSIPAGVTGMLRELICAVITRLRGRPFIIHYRCTVPNLVKSRVSLIVFKLLTNISNASIVLNNTSDLFVRKNSNTPVYLIPNFVSADEINSISHKNNQFTILYVGGVIEEKGCLDMISTAKQMPECKFRLVGAVSEEMSHVKIPENVCLLGEMNKDGVKKELSSADVFFFASFFHGEGFSNALAEAMASGLPCVVSDWAANADMIEDKGGFVVSVHDIASMAKAIKTLKANPEMRVTMGAWNQQKVRDKYTQDYVTGQYVDVYESLLLD